MNREIKFILLFVPFLLFALALGVVTKRSWIDNLDANAQIQAGDTRYLNLSDDEEYERGYLTPDAADEDSLKEVSEYILKVELNGKRINFCQSILSQVKVLQVYKDKDDILPGDEVIVYEPCSFRYDMLYYSLGGYNIMQEGKQYLLFLRYVGKSHLNPGQKGLVPVNAKFSKFEVSETEKGTLLDMQKVRAETLSYTDIENWEILTDKPDILEHYFALKGKLLQSYP